MILVFGGTTEGRKAAETLEEAGSPYYYSTKTGEQNISLHYGQRIDGAMDVEAMRSFCKEHKIRLIVDAAHPFASQLHQTIAEMAIPVIRYERIYPPRDKDITWIDDYAQVPTDIHTLLATTGVQSISKLKWLEAKGVKVIYRILNRASSIALALQQGASDDQLCFYELDYEDSSPDFPAADAILLKESGLSGGFVGKAAEARACGMRIIALKRPEGFMAHGSWFKIDGPHGLRRAVERLLPDFFPLHSGLTTGTCATAAAVAAARRLLYGETPAEVPVLLPDGETITVPVGYADGYAYCIKEAGDDPDVTDGIEVRADCRPTSGTSLNGGDWLVIEGGEGVGRFTLPGFDFSPGEAAINKGPREMLRNNLEKLITPLHSERGRGLACTISVPDGETIARKTFNPRLGIEGGISIIGVSGIVKPFSEEAFIDSIRKCVQVALASGTDRIVINSGAKSERFVKALYPMLPAQAFVQYGNYIGETLSIIADSSPSALHSSLKVTLGVMLGKAVKLAEGHLDTHSRRATMNRDFIARMLHKAGIKPVAADYTLARELWERIPECGRIPFARVVLGHCYDHCRPLLPNAELTILLIDEDGRVYE